jgi:hypothetical protein
MIVLGLFTCYAFGILPIVGHGPDTSGVQYFLSMLGFTQCAPSSHVLSKL